MNRQRGFTLMEVIAALAVFGLLLLALGQGMQFGIRAWHAQARSIAVPNELEVLDRTLRRLVTRAVSAEEALPGLSLVGGPAVLDVVARLGAAPGAGPGAVAGPAEARLEVDGRNRLMLRVLPRPNVRWTAARRPQTLVLATGVQQIEFAYWQQRPGAGGNWQRTWPGPGLPALVRIRLLFAPGDARHWPDIVAAPAMASFAAQDLAAERMAHAV